MVWDNSKSALENTADDYQNMSRDNVILIVIVFVIAGIIYLITK